MWESDIKKKKIIREKYWTNFLQNDTLCGTRVAEWLPGFANCFLSSNSTICSWDLQPLQLHRVPPSFRFPSCKKIPLVFAVASCEGGASARRCTGGFLLSGPGAGLRSEGEEPLRPCRRPARDQYFHSAQEVNCLISTIVHVTNLRWWTRSQDKMCTKRIARPMLSRMTMQTMMVFGPWWVNKVVGSLSWLLKVWFMLWLNPLTLSNSKIIQGNSRPSYVKWTSRAYWF